MNICRMCLGLIRHGDEIIQVVWNRDNHGRAGKLIDVHLRCFDWMMLERRNIRELVEFPGMVYELGVLKVRKYRDYNRGKYDAFGNRVDRSAMKSQPLKIPPDYDYVLDPEGIMKW